MYMTFHNHFNAAVIRKPENLRIPNHSDSYISWSEVLPYLSYKDGRGVSYSSNYTKLLDRPTENTYEEQKKALSLRKEEEKEQQQQKKKKTKSVQLS